MFKQNITMKKIYINPEINVVKIQPAQMIANSTPGYGGTTNETSGNAAKGGWNWDDDEPVDYEE